MLQMFIPLAITFALLVTRLAAFTFVSPFPGQAVPTNIRVGFALLMTVAAMPFAGDRQFAVGPELALAAIGEAVTGAAIAFIFRVAMAISDVIGSSLAQSSGLTFASSYDPMQGATTDALSRLVSNVALIVAFAAGAHRMMIGAVIASVRAVPVGNFIDVENYMSGILRWASSTLSCGIGLSLPAMTVGLIVQLALGLVARAAPALQVFSVGLSITIASGLLVLWVGIADTVQAIAQHLITMPRVVERLIAVAS